MIVYENIDLPGTGAPHGLVEIELWGAGRPTIGRNVNDGSLIAGKKTVLTDDQGQWSADLVPNTDIAPSNTTYRCRRFIDCEVFTSYLSVPASGGPFEAFGIGEDAMNEIPASALVGHAADLSLHGGGVEIDYSEMVTNLTVTGTALNFGFVSPLNLVIPDLGRAVYLFADVHVQVTTGTGDVSIGFFPWDGVATTVGGLSILGPGYEEDVDTDAIPNHVTCVHRLAAHTPGLYCLGARRETTPFAVTIFGNTLVRPKVWAVTA